MKGKFEGEKASFLTYKSKFWALMLLAGSILVFLHHSINTIHFCWIKDDQ